MLVSSLSLTFRSLAATFCLALLAACGTSAPAVAPITPSSAKPVAASVAPAISPTVVVPQSGNTSRPIVQRTVPGQPQGPLYWYVETFASEADAEKAAGGYTLSGEPTLLKATAGKVW